MNFLVHTFQVIEILSGRKFYHGQDNNNYFIPREMFEYLEQASIGKSCEIVLKVFHNIYHHNVSITSLFRLLLKIPLILLGMLASASTTGIMYWLKESKHNQWKNRIFFLVFTR